MGNLQKAGLIARSQEDEAAGNRPEVVLEACLARVFRYIRYWIDQTAIAEDLTMRIFHKGMAGLRPQDIDEDVLSIRLLAIARNEVRHYASQSARSPAGNNGKASGPDGCLAGEQTRDQLQISLRNLNPAEKEIIALKLGAGLNNHCIARIIGNSESKVGMHLCQALQKLNAGGITR